MISLRKSFQNTLSTIIFRRLLDNSICTIFTSLNKMAKKMNLNTNYFVEDKSKLEIFYYWIYNVKFPRHLLSEIKRKGAEHHQLADEQIIGPQNAELNKMKKNANFLNEELSSVKNQQGELEKLGKMIYTQNTQLLSENKVLWEELNKNKLILLKTPKKINKLHREKYDKKVEKLMMFAYVVMNQNGKEAISSFMEKKQLPTSRKISCYQTI